MMNAGVVRLCGEIRFFFSLPRYSGGGQGGQGRGLARQTVHLRAPSLTLPRSTEGGNKAPNAKPCSFVGSALRTVIPLGRGDWGTGRTCIAACGVANQSGRLAGDGRRGVTGLRRRKRRYQVIRNTSKSVCGADPARTPVIWMVLSCLAPLFFATAPASAWVDAAWPFRRPVDVSWEPQTAGGDELALVDFFSDGHSLPDGSDVRVATEDNRLVASHVLMAGPGDRVRVVFALVKPAKRYYIYFGNPNPGPPKAGLEDVKYQQGLLLEMRQWTGGAVDNFKQVEESWARNQPVLGRTIWDKAFIGLNPFGEQEQTIMKMTGVLSVARDGEYMFAMSADDRGALYLDGQPVLFCAQQVGDVRINAKHALTKGKHAILLYHVNTGGPMSLSVAWLPPGLPPTANNWSIVDRTALGAPLRSQAGAMEELRKTLTADFDIDREGECFFAEGYSQRYRFAAYPPKVAAKLTYDWDFGDGQTSNVPETQHVFLTDGNYPVKLTVHAGVNSDTQTIRLAVSRDYEHLDNRSVDEVAIHARMVETYNLSREPDNWMPRLGWLELKAGNLGPALAAGEKVAQAKRHADSADTLQLLQELTRQAAEKGQLDAALKVWDAVPKDSDIQPAATAYFSRMLLWWAGDYARALQVLQPYASGDAANSAVLPLKRLYAEALLLNQKADDARKILSALPIEGDKNHEAAISGASARTVEYYITQGDWESGEDAWDVWMARYPADFAQGYSLLLKTKLMEAKKAPQAAARIAEAFARAVPGSSYSPQLLDRASKLLETTDPARSSELRKLLKQRYPEDPLSQ
jgi:PKD repeat protein